MTTSLSAVLFLLFFVFCRLSSTEDNIVNVKYSKDPVRRTEGQSLTLKCTVEYHEVHCKGLKASWNLPPEQHEQLTNHDRYLIQMNETKMIEKPGFRHRDIFIQFKNLSLSNTGRYQCNGECQYPGTSAMGRLLNLTVTENPNKNQDNAQNWSDRCSVHVILLIISFTISWIN